MYILCILCILHLCMSHSFCTPAPFPACPYLVFSPESLHLLYICAIPYMPISSLYQSLFLPKSSLFQSLIYMPIFSLYTSLILHTISSLPVSDPTCSYLLYISL
ncbi:hypothetical protein XELAEV_18028777mg [Xenopus laevis]|uniref:Secreted protein n=1 Tax=Xenopus laevis TaxID=8355 RepID=A0A974CR17_XENLA|nr:hypothetical protein XELAEV_18028777mg [Xenopus laevis]